MSASWTRPLPHGTGFAPPERMAKEATRPWRRLMGQGDALCARSEWGERRNEAVTGSLERVPRQRAVSRAWSEYQDNALSHALLHTGSLGSFLDATIARSRQIENTETPNENTVTPVNSPESEYSSDDLDEDYVELDDDFIVKCNATTDASNIKKLLAQHTVRYKLSPDPKFATSPINIKDKDYDFSLDLSHISIVEKTPFCGTEKESVVEHMIELSALSSLFSDDIKKRTYFVAKIFPFSLKDDAKTWYNSLPPDSIDSPSGLLDVFFRKYFPASAQHIALQKIYSFDQEDGEKLLKLGQDFALSKRTPDEAEELLARIGRNHDDWTTPEPTPTPILKKRGMIKLNDEDMREAKKSLKEKDNDKNDASDKEEVEDEPEKHAKNKKYTKEDFIAKKHGCARSSHAPRSTGGVMAEAVSPWRRPVNGSFQSMALPHSPVGTVYMSDGAANNGFPAAVAPRVGGASSSTVRDTLASPTRLPQGGVGRGRRPIPPRRRTRPAAIERLRLTLFDRSRRATLPPDNLTAWNSFFLRRWEQELAAYDGPPPPPPRNNTAGRKRWWSVPGRTLEAVLEHIEGGNFPLLTMPPLPGKQLAATAHGCQFLVVRFGVKVDADLQVGAIMGAGEKGAVFPAEQPGAKWEKEEAERKARLLEDVARYRRPATPPSGAAVPVVDLESSDDDLYKPSLSPPRTSGRWGDAGQGSSQAASAPPQFDDDGSDNDGAGGDGDYTVFYHHLGM
ncbi:hypothetical protein QYE76_002275 [Lolium multiflorum]|uniref:Retrotransposon gag domain-containing protein n=1 Tax=Lolium multiflorum TaxID=4521 RepID=A0AAD8VXR4_LOLMU|nr:hypothetical protein QYE76_002275 [Lolium multiflorum]